MQRSKETPALFDLSLFCQESLGHFRADWRGRFRLVLLLGGHPTEQSSLLLLSGQERGVVHRHQSVRSRNHRQQMLRSQYRRQLPMGVQCEQLEFLSFRFRFEGW